MITSIQVHDELKQKLNSLKNGKESYEEVIERLIKTQEKKEEILILKDAYEELNEISENTNKEWDKIDPEWP